MQQNFWDSKTAHHHHKLTTAVHVVLVNHSQSISLALERRYIKKKEQDFTSMPNLKELLGLECLDGNANPCHAKHIAVPRHLWRWCYVREEG